jgi:hypothetical protein
MMIQYATVLRYVSMLHYVQNIRFLIQKICSPPHLDQAGRLGFLENALTLLLRHLITPEPIHTDAPTV